MFLLICLALLDERNLVAGATDVSFTLLDFVKGGATLKGIVSSQRPFFREELNKFNAFLWIEPTKRAEKPDFKKPIVDVFVDCALVVTEHATV